MNATIETSPDYFGRKWHLVLEREGEIKRLYLGQDAKVCSRLLGLTPSEVIDKIGGRDLSDEKNLKRLALLILEHLEEHEAITAEECFELADWSLSVE
jgi:hypothetical protein